jgi:hypothetical protein
VLAASTLKPLNCMFLYCPISSADDIAVLWLPRGFIASLIALVLLGCASMSSKVHSMSWTTTTGFAGVVSLCVFAMFTMKLSRFTARKRGKCRAQSAVGWQLENGDYRRGQRRSADHSRRRHDGGKTERCAGSLTHLETHFLVAKIVVKPFGS